MTTRTKLPNLNQSPKRLGKRRQRIMVGSRSTPVLSRTFNYPSTHTSLSTTTTSTSHQQQNQSATTPQSDTSSVIIADPMKHHLLLREEIKTDSNTTNPFNPVQHTKEELQFYLAKIQSGEKPEPVVLPVSIWKGYKNGRPISLSSTAYGGGSIASTAWSQLNTTARNQKLQWMYSDENPQVLPIKHGTKDDYQYDAAGRAGRSNNNTTAGSNQSDYSTAGKNHHHYKLRSKKVLYHNPLNHVHEQMFMPPEQSPIVERIRQNLKKEKLILYNVRKQKHKVLQHLKQLPGDVRPSKHGSVSRDVLLQELTAILCQENVPNSMTRKDIDRLLCSTKHLDVNGNVNIQTLLDMNSNGTTSKAMGERVGGGPRGGSTGRRTVRNDVVIDNTDQYGSHILQKELIHDGLLIPNSKRASAELSMKRVRRDTSRVIVPATNTDQYEHPRHAYRRSGQNNQYLDGVGVSNKEERDKKLLNVQEREMDRSIQHSVRVEYEENERNMKDHEKLASIRATGERYQLFLEKEELRRVKMGNRFALGQFKQYNPQRKHQKTQYRQEIGGFHRDNQVAKYNRDRVNLNKKDWKRIYRPAILSGFGQPGIV